MWSICDARNFDRTMAYANSQWTDSATSARGREIQIPLETLMDWYEDKKTTGSSTICEHWLLKAIDARYGPGTSTPQSTSTLYVSVTSVFYLD